ncbi:MAG: amino acid adenylation domain-containing protein [Clostridia bacterium]|nr:amino acid adenylation domain-containing protein [Clostridia bacterium]
MDKSVLNWLQRTAAQSPDKTAYSDVDSSVKFSDVLKYARSVGTAAAKRNTAGKPVAVFAGRSCLTPAVFLGVVFGGSCYAPIDGKLPKNRISRILDNLDPALIIADRAYEESISQLALDCDVLFTEDILDVPADEELLSEIAENANENDPLYIIFTSGSTGNPKGVVTSHHSLMCYIDAYSEVMGIEPDDVLGNQSPLDYIAAIRDIYLPLYTGCSTVILPKEYFMEPARLFDFMTERGVTAVGWSVSAMTVPASLGAFEHGRPEHLKKICFSGSVMPNRCLRTWQENMPDAMFVNQYGPTEATASCTCYRVTEKADDGYVLPIGKAYKNYRVFLLNEDNTATPPGEKGEICVSGPILALGYYNDPERTHKSFVQNPLNKSYNELIYKTGDIGRLRADGNMEFHGRKDRQIKHMGHRVELDEIESACDKIEGVDECCALYDSENERIVLFHSGAANVRDIASGLRKDLPGFMVPRKFIYLEALPRLANGKTDMTALKQRMK